MPMRWLIALILLPVACGIPRDDWRLHDVVIAPTSEIHDELEDVEEPS